MKLVYCLTDQSCTDVLWKLISSHIHLFCQVTLQEIFDLTWAEMQCKREAKVTFTHICWCLASCKGNICTTV